MGFEFNFAKGVPNSRILSNSHRYLIEDVKYTLFGILTETNNEGTDYFTQIFITKYKLVY